jgi:hypothetical protein
MELAFGAVGSRAIHLCGAIRGSAYWRGNERAEKFWLDPLPGRNTAAFGGEHAGAFALLNITHHFGAKGVVP